MNLFTYGSLMFPEVMSALTGRNWESEPAILSDYACLNVAGQVYPGILARGGAETEGRLYRNLSAEDLALFDRFEDDFYARKTVQVMAGDHRVEAEAYCVPDARSEVLEDQLWNPTNFAHRHKADFIAMCESFTIESGR